MKYDRNRLRTLLTVCFLTLGTAASHAQTWFSLQEGDVRSGSDSTTVNTAGTLVTSAYVSGGTYIRGYLSKAQNFNTDTNLLLGTRNFGTTTDLDSLRMLLSFDMTPIVNYVNGNAYSIDAVNLIITHRTLGGGANSGMSLYSTTPFNEATATWDNPGGGAAAGGYVPTTALVGGKGIVGLGTSYPSNQLWTSSALVTAVQTAIANSTNKNAYFLLKRGTEGDADYWSTYVTDENTDPAYGGVDARPELQVKVTILSNAPLVSIAATDPVASEPDQDTGTFTITRSGNVDTDVTVYISYTGSAKGWEDFRPSVTGSVVLASGVTTTNITVTPVDDANPEDTETITLSITPNASYGIGVGSATVSLQDNNDGAALVQWFFGNNTVPQVWSTNITATDGFTPGLSYTYSGSSTLLSSPGALYVMNTLTTATEADAVANNDYMAVSLSPKLGYATTLTNFEMSTIYYNSMLMEPVEAVVFVRSSLDNFTTNLVVVTNGAFNLGGSWITTSIPLGPEFANRLGTTEFRVYVYDDVNKDGDAGIRLDNLYVRGEAFPLSDGLQQVALAVTDANAAEPADNASFTVTRGGSTAAPLDVYYTVSGSASNGVDYATLSGMATIPAGSASTTLNVAVTDDLLQEANESVILTLVATNTYIIYGSASATATIVDNLEPTQAFVVAGDDNVYERLPGCYGWFNIGRSGDTTTGFTVNFTLTGDAVAGADYISSVTNSISFAAGETSKTVYIYPIDDPAVEPVEHVVLTVTSGTGYITPGQTAATMTVTSDDLAAETVWFSDNFETAASSANWYVLEAGADGVADSLIDYSFDYGTLGIPPAPGSTTTKGLLVSANKVAPNKTAAVNLFPLGLVASNNFALKFDAYVQWNATNDFAEFALAGINHSGTVTNWRNSSTPVFLQGDGQFVFIANDDRDNPGIATMYGYASATNTTPSQLALRNRASLSGLFNNPPYGSVAHNTNGTPACDVWSTTKTWVQCELRQVGGVVEFVMNGLPLISITNQSAFTNGLVMIGYSDPFDSASPAENFALFDNVRVVELASAPAAAPSITTIAVNGNNVVVTFTGDASDAPSAYKLQSAGAVGGTFTVDDSAIVTGSGGQFQAVTTVNGGSRFYRIRRN